MKRKWKTIESTRRPAAGLRLVTWLMDKDYRASFAWLGSFVGICFIVAYQMTLPVGFTPQVNFTEGALVLCKAALMGLLLFASIYAGVFAPAASLRLLDIDVDRFNGEEKRDAVRALMRRSVCAQVFGGFYPAALFLYRNADAPRHIWIAALFSLISIAALVGTLGAPRLPKETKAGFYLSFFIIASSALFSLLMFVLSSGMRDNAESLTYTTLSWLSLTLVSGILSTAGKKVLVPSCLAALLLLVFILGLLGQLAWPFRAVAVSVGIAQPGPVTLVFPEKTCAQIQRAIFDLREVSCMGADPGIVKDVEVLNSWGSRWLIRLGKRDMTRIVSFDGNGTVIIEDKAGAGSAAVQRANK